MSPNAGGRGRGCGVSANEYSSAHGAQINFGDVSPYLTYGRSISHSERTSAQLKNFCSLFSDSSVQHAIQNTPLIRQPVCLSCPLCPVAEFIHPYWEDKVNSGIGLSYRPARLNGLANGSRHQTLNAVFTGV
jgi:hypothetical protein